VILACFNLLPDSFLSFMAKCPAISAYQAHLFCIAGGGGYTYLSEPLWWAGMTTSTHVPLKFAVNLNFTIQLNFLSVDLVKCFLGRLQTLSLTYLRRLYS
jgi:hypothetical protein